MAARAREWYEDTPTARTRVVMLADHVTSTLPITLEQYRRMQAAEAKAVERG